MAAAWTNDEIELVAELGYELHLQGKNREARVIFEGLLAVDPRNLYCLEALAALNLALGEPTQAVECASRALALSPNRIEALASRCEGNVLLYRFMHAQRDLEALKQLEAPQVARLGMRIASAQKLSTSLLSDATLPEPDR